MRRKNNVDILSVTNSLKILSFLSDNPGKEFLGSEIQKATSVSRVGVYIGLRDLIKKKLAFKAKKGKFLVYSVPYDDPFIRQFKVLRNIVYLKPFLAKLEPSSKKIVLYGSASRGEDDSSSDMDLFIVSKEPQAAKAILSTLKTKRRIQAVVKSPVEVADFKEREKVFYEEVNRGITLWEEKE